MVGKQLPFIVNLEPRKMMGLESQGMLIATDDENGAVLLLPERPVPAGANIK
jgi:tRNA-binding EMAP/Myf-like protein